MINTYAYKKLTWIDLESPTRDEVRQVMEQYHVDPLVAQELLTPSLKPKIQKFDKFIYLILNFPVSRRAEGKNKAASAQEVDFIVGKEFIITARYDTVDPLHRFARIFEVNSVLDKNDIGDHAGYIFFYMIEKIYQSLGNQLESIDDQLIKIEEDIFAQREKEMVFELSNVSRDLLDLKKAMAHHKMILGTFGTMSSAFFGKEFDGHSARLIEEYGKIEETIGGQFDLLEELRSTNDSLLSTKQNEVMKFFTVITSVIFSVDLIVSLLTINLASNPFAGVVNNYAITMGTVAIIAICMLGYFSYKKWL